METVATREREQHFRFPCPELGIQPSDPAEIPFHTLNYFYAMSYAMDLKSRGTYVDVGCGSGHGTEMLAPFFRKSYGIDRDETAVKYARLLHGRAGTEYLHSPDFQTDPFHKAVDFITLIETIEHVPGSLASVLMTELQDWLAPEGALFITTPAGTTKDGLNPMNPWHQHEYQPGELKALLSNHFNRVDLGVRSGAIQAVCREPKE